MSKAAKKWYSFTEQALATLKAVDQSFHWNPRVTGFILAVALVNAGLYHKPLYSFAVTNLDYSSLSGVLTLATLFFLVTFVTTLIFSLLSLVSLVLSRPFACLAPCAMHSHFTLSKPLE